MTLGITRTQEPHEWRSHLVDDEWKPTGEMRSADGFKLTVSAQAHGITYEQTHIVAAYVMNKHAESVWEFMESVLLRDIGGHCLMSSSTT